MTGPLLLGHRGARACRHIPENTLASFELCLQHGCDGFEFDVRRSADGQAVIRHDATIAGVKIENAAAKSLPLPTVEEVLRQFADRAFLDIEFKVADGELVELVHAAGKRIMVWTVNRAERMREFAAWGVDAIISDDTELLVRSVVT